MDRLNFYYVDKRYTDFLAKEELATRGKVTIPFIEYPGRKTKFACGIVLQTGNGFNYYVALSSYKIQRNDNMLIFDIQNGQKQIKASLRFNYMIPVPRETLTLLEIEKISDPLYRTLVRKEYIFVRENEEAIRQKGLHVYDKIINRHAGTRYLENSCDYRFLEQKCIEYCKVNNYNRHSTVYKLDDLMADFSPDEQKEILSMAENMQMEIPRK